jgi:hypothetical protein
MNYEQIGKEAVAAGYDGGGIWKAHDFNTKWFAPTGCMQLKNGGWWPDFSYAETEGAALEWIADKKKANIVFVDYHNNNYVVNARIAGLCYILGVSSQRAASVLSAIKSLGLGKKDNSPTGLNKRLLEVGFRRGGCRWIDTGNGVRELFEHDVNDLSVYFCWLPDGSHPSTIGVATAWLRGFEKVGEKLHFCKSIGGNWIAAHENVVWQGDYEKIPECSSELEALVEFAEWAKEAGLLE